MAMTSEAQREVPKETGATGAERRAAKRTKALRSAERRAEVVRLALGGMTFDQIGARLSPSVSGERARQLFFDALARQVKAADVDQARVLANARLERLLARWWPRAMFQALDGQGRPDTSAGALVAADEVAGPATDRVLKILAELNKVNGAYRPIEVDVAGEVIHRVEVSTSDVLLKLAGLRAQQVTYKGPWDRSEPIDVPPRELPAGEAEGG